MYALRRHRRQLLFPPGLLALGFLLLLGCGVVGQNAERLKKHHLIQIQPVIKQSRQEGNRIIKAPILADLERQLWHTVTFTGNMWQRYFSLRETQTALLNVPDRSEQNIGLRIRFTKQASYEELVQGISLVKMLGLEKWWLDMRYEPTTLYIPGARTHARNFIVQDLIDTPESGLYGCVESSFILLRPTLGGLSFLDRVDEYMIYRPITATWFPWLQLEWHTSLCVFLAIAFLSVIHLFRQWRRASG